MPQRHEQSEDFDYEEPFLVVLRIVVGLAGHPFVGRRTELTELETPGDIQFTESRLANPKKQRRLTRKHPQLLSRASWSPSRTRISQRCGEDPTIREELTVNIALVQMRLGKITRTSAPDIVFKGLNRYSFQ